MRFSTEPNNLRSLSSYKHSGLANTQCVGITSTDKHTAVLSLRTSSKSSSSVGGSTIPINKSFQKVCDTVGKSIVTNYYRPDLKQDALAKYSCVYKANRVAKGVKKAVPVKKGRN